jgi:hypothetical protein
MIRSEPWEDDLLQEPLSETITHQHPTLPFIEIHQSRYIDHEPGDERWEKWSFVIFGPTGSEAVAYDGAAYIRMDLTEVKMIAFMADKAERCLLHEGGPFFVLRMYLESGAYRKPINAVMRKHGRSPLWRRLEAEIGRRLGIEIEVIALRSRLRAWRPPRKVRIWPRPPQRIARPCECI